MEKSCCIPITPIFFDDLQKREFDNGIYLEMADNQIKQGEIPFCVTALKIRLRSTDIIDAQSIISAKNGEAEAKTIRNAFQTASTPSRGLMNELNIE